MDNKSKILLTIIIIITIISIGYTFYDTVLRQNFQIVDSPPSDETTDLSSNAD